MDPEQVARKIRHDNRTAYQEFLDTYLRGSAIARAALEVRYEPIIQFVKEGPDVGERDETESKAGRVN